MKNVRAVKHSVLAFLVNPKVKVKQKAVLLHWMMMEIHQESKQDFLKFTV